MEISIFFLVLVFLLQTPQSLSTYVLEEGSSLSVEESNDYLISKNGVYSAEFFSVGINTYCFAIWFTKSSPLTVAWMANRDNPVNGKGSRISVMKNGNLSLTDAGRILIWNSKTFSPSPVQLVLSDSGNLVLQNSSGTIWESFDSPTDTLLPQQRITRDTKLVSSRSGSDYSSGFYSFYFDNDNVLRLLYDDSEVSSVYWPDPSQMAWVFRTMYNKSRIAVFDNLGEFLSSDKLSFRAADFGLGPQRRLTLDFDGSVRMYSLMEAKGTWTVTWQDLSTCSVHGLCGQNNLCNYDPKTGRSCSCLPGFKLKNHLDWSLGCVPDPESIIHCNQTEVDFLKLQYVDFYGNDIGFIEHSNLSHCRKICAQSCDCKAFTLKSNQGDNKCYPKFLLHNGLRSVDFYGITYVKLPKASSVFRSNVSDKSQRKETWDCPRVRPTEELNRVYKKRKVNETQRILLWFAGGVRAVEITCMFLVWFCLYRTSNDPDDTKEGYILAATGFKLFSYDELKKATNGFSEEIGRGAGGVVYKGVLSDGRVAAIKRLGEASQGEAEFLAEVSIIGKLNHVNLIKMWGYCVQGKHRLLVSEYMEHGS